MCLSRGLGAVLALIGSVAMVQDAPAKPQKPRPAPAPAPAAAPASRNAPQGPPEKPAPTATISPDGVQNVAKDEVAGRVVDAKGKPVSGVAVDMQHWFPDHPTTKTDADGVFRFAKVDARYNHHVRIRPETHAWQQVRRPAGESGWLITLRDDVKVEGRVIGQDGKPVAKAPVVADGGPRRSRGFVQGETLTETTTDNDGKFVLYLEPGEFDVSVRVAGAGIAKKKITLADAESRSLDLKLAPGAKFTVLFIDHDSGEPVPFASLAHWQKPGIEGVSDEKGVMVIRDVPPGLYDRFQVKAPGFARWWSDSARSPFSRLEKNDQVFQRNFDYLDFEITAESGPVTIEMEKCVTIRGRVLDPDGKPVAGATVAPARTGSGNSLTGDTRFSVRTNKDGSFVSLLPTSNGTEYNLVAHDGDYGEFRKWANGASKPFLTTPGTEKKGFELRLTRPGIVTGKVVGADGKPVKGREVRCIPAAMDENRYYDATTVTDAEGKFTIKFARPGEAFIQLSPFWLDPKQAPPGTSVAATVKAGETLDLGEWKVPPE